MEETYKLDLTKNTLLVIDKAIQQLPYYEAKPIIDEINRQIAIQEANKQEGKQE